MENKQKKSVGTIALVILLLIVTIVSIVLATYAWAKYTTTSGPQSATATVAKWDVSFTPGNDTFTGSYSHVVTGKIAPGTSGTFTVTPVPGDTEVCFNYTIKIDSVQFLAPDDSVLPDTTTLDNNGTPEVTTDDITLADLRSHIRFTNAAGTDVTDGALTSGTYNLGSHNSTTGAALNPTGAQTFTWNWPYELTTAGATEEEKAAYDKIDTAAGKYSDEHATATVNGLRMKVNYTATAVQVDPANANH